LYKKRTKTSHPPGEKLAQRPRKKEKIQQKSKKSSEKAKTTLRIKRERVAGHLGGVGGRKARGGGGRVWGERKKEKGGDSEGMQV